MKSLGFMNPLAYMSDEQIAALSTLVRRTGLELSARAIEARALEFGDGCHLDGTVALLMLMVADHVVEVWHDDCVKALRELTRALAFCLAYPMGDGTVGRTTIDVPLAQEYHFAEPEEQVDVYIGPEPTDLATLVVYHVDRTLEDGDHD